MSTSTLRAFHGDPAIKQKYLDRVAAHRANDELVRGHYWEQDKNGVFRGCAVGCTLEYVGFDLHATYEKELGIPTMLARAEDSIFEHLPIESEWLAWPTEFLEAIPVGADLSLVWPRLLIWILSDPEYGTRTHCLPDGAAATDTIIQLVEAVVRGETTESEAWHEASEAASSSQRDDAGAFQLAYVAVVVACDGDDLCETPAVLYEYVNAMSPRHLSRANLWRLIRHKLLELLRTAPVPQ